MYVASNVNFAVNSRSFLLWCCGFYLDFFFRRPFDFSFWRLLETFFLRLWKLFGTLDIDLENWINPQASSVYKMCEIRHFVQCIPCRMEHPSTSTSSNRRCHPGGSLQPTIPLHYRCCCINEAVLFGHCVHLELGHRFHALFKVCSDHDDIVSLSDNAWNTHVQCTEGLVLTWVHVEYM